MNPGSFFAELKRPNVYKVAIAYAVAAWRLIQIATQVFPFLEIPNSAGNPAGLCCWLSDLGPQSQSFFLKEVRTVLVSGAPFLFPLPCREAVSYKELGKNPLVKPAK